MSQVITKRVRLSRRAFLKGLTAAGAPIVVGLPPLVVDVQLARHRLRRRPAARSRESRSRAASCSGSTATAFRSATGFPPKTGADYT